MEPYLIEKLFLAAEMDVKLLPSDYTQKKKRNKKKLPFDHPSHWDGLV